MNNRSQILRPRGFTLLELLVVLVIIGVIAGAALLSTGDRRIGELHHQGERLFTLLRWCAEDALTRQVELGLVVADDGYQLLEWSVRDAQWLAPTSAAVPTAVKLPEYLMLRVLVSGEQENPFAAEENGDAKVVPGILFLSSGEVTDFELTLAVRDKEEFTLTISGGGYGDLRWLQP